MMDSNPQFLKDFIRFVPVEVGVQKKLKNLLAQDVSESDLQTNINDIFAHLQTDLEKYRALILQLENSEQSFFNYDEIHRLNPIIAKVLGSLIVQNEQGDQVISVYDRNRLGSMAAGARYHQTREGGSIHTDNVNTPELWDYLYLSCLAQGQVGGENIFVDGVQIHQQLKQAFPEALAVLEANFVWEMRGIGDTLYHAPIITYNAKGEPLFRHLRPYMESAHQRANQALSYEQLYALDVLDALTGSSEYQFRYRMKKGDVLINRDAQVLHGRTCFSDAINAVTLDELKQGLGPVLKRTMERIWIKKH